jgi:hypothetical protein
MFTSDPMKDLDRCPCAKCVEHSMVSAEKISSAFLMCMDPLRGIESRKLFETTSLAWLKLGDGSITCSVPGACGTITCSPKKVLVQRVLTESPATPVSEENFRERFLHFLFLQVKTTVEEHAWMTRSMHPKSGIRKREIVNVKIGIEHGHMKKGITLFSDAGVSFRVVQVQIKNAVHLCVSAVGTCPSSSFVVSSPPGGSSIKSLVSAFHTPPVSRKRRRDSIDPSL